MDLPTRRTIPAMRVRGQKGKTRIERSKINENKFSPEKTGWAGGLPGAEKPQKQPFFAKVPY